MHKKVSDNWGHGYYTTFNTFIAFIGLIGALVVGILLKRNVLFILHQRRTGEFTTTYTDSDHVYDDAKIHQTLQTVCIWDSTLFNFVFVVGGGKALITFNNVERVAIICNTGQS